MTSVLDTSPDAQAYAFKYRFQIGNSLRATRSSELHIEAERHREEVRLFLDTGGLVQGIEQAAEPVNTNLLLGAISEDVRPIPTVEWQPAAGLGPAVHRTSPLSGARVSIRAGTEIGVSPSPSGQDTEELRVRFLRDTEIEVGVREASPLQKHNLRGIRPVLLDGSPLLEITASHRASVRLDVPAFQTAILNLIGIISPYRRGGGDSALYHVFEVIGDRVVGGASIELRI